MARQSVSISLATGVHLRLLSHRNWLKRSTAFTTTAGQSVESGETVTVDTSAIFETNEYLDKTATNIYRSSSPQIVREVLTHGGNGAYGSHEQLVCVRFLQPPEVPPPGPLIIREVRPPQAAPPPTLVINECPPLPEKQPPLILREEPPIPPPIIPSETITKYLPAISAPARSVLIKRYPALPTRPRDILIERWLPYGPRPQRETITYPAPPAISYPEPFFRIIQYEGGHASIHHRFEKLFARENPEYYRTRYGSSLLDTTTLLRLAREAGVSEDLV
ncbi:unnamed protein product [Adineta steineri]|uniref:Uncharacterized protein n=1 Tax=Adineta steineri TaxID=433720 RepID=A0A815NL24_9BILA|nr:unnamed protein product [Adineta steineri]